MVKIRTKILLVLSVDVLPHLWDSVDQSRLPSFLLEISLWRWYWIARTLWRLGPGELASFLFFFFYQISKTPYLTRNPRVASGFLASIQIRGVQLIFTGGHISLTIAFKGLNVILGLYKCNYSLPRGKELGAASRQKQGGGPHSAHRPCVCHLCFRFWATSPALRVIEVSLTRKELGPHARPSSLETTNNNSFLL